MRLVLSLIMAVLLVAAVPAAAATHGQALRGATVQGLSRPAQKLSGFRGKPLTINVREILRGEGLGQPRGAGADRQALGINVPAK